MLADSNIGSGGATGVMPGNARPRPGSLWNTLAFASFCLSLLAGLATWELFSVGGEQDWFSGFSFWDWSLASLGLFAILFGPSTVSLVFGMVCVRMNRGERGRGYALAAISISSLTPIGFGVWGVSYLLNQLSAWAW
jgi:hypothetical protein